MNTFKFSDQDYTDIRNIIDIIEDMFPHPFDSPIVSPTKRRNLTSTGFYIETDIADIECRFKEPITAGEWRCDFKEWIPEEISDEDELIPAHVVFELSRIEDNPVMNKVIFEHHGTGREYAEWKRRLNREYKYVKITFQQEYKTPKGEYVHTFIEATPYDTYEQLEREIYGDMKHESYLMSDDYESDCRSEQWDWLKNA